MIGILTLLGVLALFGLLLNEIFWKDTEAVEREVAGIKFPKTLSWTIGLIVIGYNLFYYDMSFEIGANIGIGMGLFNLIVILGLLIAYPRIKRTPLVYIIGIFSILIGLTSGLRANEFIQIFNTSITRITLLALAIMYIVDPIKWEGLWLTKTLWNVIKKSNKTRRSNDKSSFPKARVQKNGTTIDHQDGRNHRNNSNIFRGTSKPSRPDFRRADIGHTRRSRGPHDCIDNVGRFTLVSIEP